MWPGARPRQIEACGVAVFMFCAEPPFLPSSSNAGSLPILPKRNTPKARVTAKNLRKKSAAGCGNARLFPVLPRQTAWRQLLLRCHYSRLSIRRTFAIPISRLRDIREKAPSQSQRQKRSLRNPAVTVTREASRRRKSLPRNTRRIEWTLRF
jgi:hypothetical protein